MRETPSLRPSGFGTRYLVDKEKVWDHNAWDNPEWNDEMEQNAKRIIEGQKIHPVEESSVDSLLSNPARQWNNFYSRHTNKFFMDRKWLLKEFPELDMATYASDARIRVLEVGCGVGNTSFPLLEWDANKQMYLYSCDYSLKAVDIVKGNENYDETRCKAFVWDITEPNVDEIEPESIDVITCIFVLSAIPPTKYKQAIKNLAKLLKPNGCILVKDYARFDLSQLRFKRNRFIEENLYCRGDGTLVYYRTREEMENDFKSCGLEPEACTYDRRLIVNRAEKLQMHRVWIQAKFVKKG